VLLGAHQICERWHGVNGWERHPARATHRSKQNKNDAAEAPSSTRGSSQRVSFSNEFLDRVCGQVNEAW
jgi:hypothetical protein